MKNFKVRIWNDIKKEMIYPSESFIWTLSLCGEIFHNCGTSIKDKERCKILLYSGLRDCAGEDLYEGDLVTLFNNENYVELCVCFDNGEFCLIRLSDHREPEYYESLTETIIEKEQIELIGNVFENNYSKKVMENLF